MSKMKYINWSTKIFAGFYESNLYNSDTLYNLADEDGGYDFVDDGYEKFEKAVSESCVSELLCNMDQGADELIKSMTFVKLLSPKYYNFETDKLEIEVDCDWPGLVDYAKNKHRQAFDEYLKENFTSYDGFISFVPNNVGEFFVKLDDDFDRLSEVIIEFYILSTLDQNSYDERCAEIAFDELWNHIESVKEVE